jgi:hypothetical protein
LIAASVWIRLLMRSPLLTVTVRPVADTIPDVTEFE